MTKYPLTNYERIYDSWTRDTVFETEFLAQDAPEVQGMRCGYCGSAFHEINLCSGTWSESSNRSNLRCTYCGAKDYDIHACPKTRSGNVARAWNPESVSTHFVKDKE